jgi:hypothetical protein
MRAVLLAALLALGCRIDLDERDDDANTTGRSCKVSTASVCVEAETHSDFTWIEDKIFAANCFGSSCHTGSTASGKRDLSDGVSYATLMGPSGTGGVKANLAPTHDLVVPGSPEKSYLYIIMRGIEPEDADPPVSPPPSNIGYMPMSNSLLCCQKIDAVERWIAAGAMND